eukprot:CAMPEP_0185769842 /NCGR_PEP_ID=MMETSP1174-20130828/56177_1 /TAXON_ID=35687 /ORGANISM="Dictyocha speculum, Strain CCMP1381" /LENGTH=348 /DNA_ID=CAMNT_0028455059 /DNA_START=24 /DNA_END=1073 /DNA_ORIENTATION=-
MYELNLALYFFPALKATEMIGRVVGTLANMTRSVGPLPLMSSQDDVADKKIQEKPTEKSFMILLPSTEQRSLRIDVSLERPYTQAICYPPAHFLPMESGLGHKETWMLCGAPIDPGGNQALFCAGGTWGGVVQTFLKLAVRDFCTAVAADVESLVTNVVVEAKGQLADNNWPGDITGRVKGQEFAIDVFATRIGSASNRGQSVYKLIAEGDDEVKHRYYAKLWKDRNILVFFFGMDAEGGCASRPRIPSASSRTGCRAARLGVTPSSVRDEEYCRQMQLVLDRQQKRSSRYSQIADLAARRDGGASAMLGGSNRGTGRFVSIAGLSRCSVLPFPPFLEFGWWRYTHRV